MPEHLKSLIVILVLSSIVFAYAKTLIPQFIDKADFSRRKTTWLIIVLIAYVIHNFWILALAMLLLLSAKLKSEKNVVALYLFLLLALPSGEIAVPGFGLVNYLLMISYQKLLVLILLFPLMFKIASKSHDFKFGKVGSDKFLLMYLCLLAFVFIRDTTTTDMLRQTFNNFIEIFVPYFVISRYIKTMAQFRDALLSFLIAIMVVAMIALFEFLKSWLLFASLPSLLEIQDMTSYLGRAGSVRACATTGHSIALGFTMAVGISLFLYFKEFAIKRSVKKSGIAILLAGAYAGLSRGPWMGALFAWICFTLTGRKAIQKLISMLLFGVIALGVLSVLPGGEKVINLIPFIGKTESENVTYRQHLFENSSIVIQRNFWTGSPNYIDTPEMQEMRNGVGVIDIVNSYLGIMLSSGFIGLFLFLGFFLSLIYRILITIKNIPDKNSEEHLLGRALFATLCGILFTITTTSSIGMIPIIYWAIAGLTCAYLNIAKNRITSNRV